MFKMKRNMNLETLLDEYRVKLQKFNMPYFC